MTVTTSPARRGDHVISRKAIAQGMSDALRCPVCSCAHFLLQMHTRPRVQRAPGIPCALCFREGRGISGKPRAQCTARMRNCIRRHCERSDLSAEALAKAEAIHVAAYRSMDCFVADAPRNDVERPGHDNQIFLTPADTPAPPAGRRSSH